MSLEIRTQRQYIIPNEFYHRIHHCRPRFKNDVESVLIYIATTISDMQEAPTDEFQQELFSIIYNYPGNIIKTPKTIHNWRTEITSLFGFVEYDTLEKVCCKPGKTAKMLASNQDLVQFFKSFLFTFQYPGAHIKPREIKDLIEAGIKFKPAHAFLRVLKAGEEIYGSFNITKAEATHCIFNDLRVTRDNRDQSATANLIRNNRDQKKSYDENSDVIRYAGDILDYMVLANLLKKDLTGRYYSLNWSEIHTISVFLADDNWFPGYDELYLKRRWKYRDIVAVFVPWFRHVNEIPDIQKFRTNLSALRGFKKSKKEEVSDPVSLFLAKIAEGADISPLEIGNLGQNLIIAHEKQRLEKKERQDLQHLILQIPNSIAVGYDIQSFEHEGGVRRFIEVKTTISRNITRVNTFKMTDNEFNAANQYGDSYYIYRLQITPDGSKLFLIKNPVDKFKKDIARMELRKGAIFTFPSGELPEEELMYCQN